MIQELRAFARLTKEVRQLVLAVGQLWQAGSLRRAIEFLEQKELAQKSGKAAAEASRNAGKGHDDS